MSDEQADVTARTLAQFDDLLQAATPEGDQRATLHRRLQAKLSHSAILTRASFNADAQDARHATRHAAHHIQICTQMLVHG